MVVVSSITDMPDSRSRRAVSKADTPRMTGITRWEARSCSTATNATRSDIGLPCGAGLEDCSKPRLRRVDMEESRRLGQRLVTGLQRQIDRLVLVDGVLRDVAQHETAPNSRPDSPAREP